MKPIYLDYNASTPVDSRAAEAMMPWIHEHFGNPSSGHIFGRNAKEAVEKARQQTADMIGAAPQEIIFTSGGSEANNYAIKGMAFARKDKGRHIITSEIEHPAVTRVCQFLERRGFKITWLPVDSYGMVDPADAANAITPETILVTIMHSNNETGTIQPIAEIGEITQKHGIVFHSDCAQSIGKVPVNVNDLNVDMLSIAGHKFYAPIGVGALYVREGLHLQKLIHGAGQENNRRAGTSNVMQIAGLGKACEIVSKGFPESVIFLKELRDHLEQEILSAVPEAMLNGHPGKRLPNTSSISFKGLEANAIVEALDDIAAVSAGAACHSSKIEVSCVLESMKIPLKYAMGTIRFSVGRFSSKDNIDGALEKIIRVIKGMLQTKH